MPLRMTQPPFFTVVCKRKDFPFKDLPFIVGRADRVPICRKLRQPIRSNCGLVQSRAVATMALHFLLSQLGGKVLTRSTYPNIIESYPVVCILSPEATEDLHHAACRSRFQHKHLKPVQLNVSI
jgi:hypothetical protein